MRARKNLEGEIFKRVSAQTAPAVQQPPNEWDGLAALCNWQLAQLNRKKPEQKMKSLTDMAIDYILKKILKG